MSETQSKGVEEACNQLLDLLEAAEKGQSTIITRNGRPIETFNANARQQSLLPLKGSGGDFWSKDSARTLRDLRAEWER